LAGDLAFHDHSCRSAVAYRDVGEGREQDAEASPVRLFFVMP